MGFLGFGKKREFVDLGEKYRKQQEKIANMKEDARSAHQENNSYADLSQSSSTSPSTPDSGSSNGLGFFSNMASAGSQNSQPQESSGDLTTPHERRRMLNKKLSTITEKLEDLSNQIYHLQQRVEVIERKSGVGRY